MKKEQQAFNFLFCAL